MSVREAWAMLAFFVAAATALFLTAPKSGDFWWPDASRHALNGAFLKDFLTALPLHDPVGWAAQYYVHFPALTILFYPPAFYVVEAAFYALFGVSHAVAQLAVIPYIVMLGFSAAAIARTILPRWTAVSIGLMVISTPEAALWSRQVMLDIPAYAALMFGALFFVRYMRYNRYVNLYISFCCIVIAAYTKFTAIFIIPALLISLAVVRGLSALLDKRTVIAALASGLALLPALAMTMRFGSANIESVVGRGIDIPRASFDAWTFYPSLLPQQLGMVPASLGLCGLAVMVLRRGIGGERWAAPLLVSWLLLGYVFFSAIGVREPRHDLMVLYPILLGSGLALHFFLPKLPAQALAVILAGTIFVGSVFFDKPPRVTGYQEAADYVAAHAPRNGVILFSGYRDGNFVFNMRAHEERNDVTTLRADKLLLRIAVERARGVGQSDQDEAGIAEMLRQDGVGMVVAQAGFWDDLREMGRLNRVLASPLFEEVATFPISGELSVNDGQAGNRLIRILRPTYTVTPPAGNLRIELPIIGGQAKGRISHE